MDILLYLKGITNKDLLELCSMSCGHQDGRGVWERMDTCTCMTESLCVHLKLSQHCLSAIPQHKTNSLKKRRPSFLHKQPWCLCCKSGDCIHVSLFLDSVSFPLYPVSKNPGLNLWGQRQAFPKMLFLGEDMNAFALVEFFGFFSPTYFPSLYKDKGGSELQARHWQTFFIMNSITSTFSNRKKI